MIETIGVTYVEVIVNGFTTWHLALFYTNAQGQTTFLQAKPEFGSDQLPTSESEGEVWKELWATTNKNDGSPFGVLVMGPTAGTQGPQETLLTSTGSLEDIWNSMEADAQAKLAEGYEYRPLQQNSNTFAATILTDAGIRLPTGAPIGLSYIPGLQYLLHDPIGRQQDVPDSLGATQFAFANPNANTTSLVVSDPTDISVQWGNGTVTYTLNGVTSNAVPDTSTSVISSNGFVVLIGSSLGNIFDGGGVDCLMLGGLGNDTFLLGYGGNDWVDGGAGNNTATYSKSSDSYTVTLAAANGIDTGPRNDQIVDILDNNTGGLDELAMVENINFVTPGNTVFVKPLADGLPPPSDLTTINLGATSRSSGEIVDFSQYNGNVYLSSGNSQSTPAVTLFSDQSFTQSLSYAFTNFNTLILGNGNNKVSLQQADDPYLTLVQAGNGNNKITSSVVNLTIDLGSGSNIVYQVAPGTIVNEASSGQDDIVASADELITGSTPGDAIFSPGGIQLHGATGEIGSSDPWIVGPDGTKYGFNQQGYLVIQSLLGGDTYVAGYQGGPNVGYSQQSDSIFVGLHEVYAERLLDLTRPYMENIHVMFKLGNEILFTKSGRAFFNADPLVFDLSGNGINLTAMTTASPMLDMQGTGFAVPTGWVEPGEGVLVLEQAGANGTPNITEMLGGPGAEGFAALAQYDVNRTGVLDASDPIWSQLRIWVDSNGNGVVDPGELETLQQAGIASIDLTSTTQTNDTVDGNTITATGTFTRSDGSTSDIADVSFNIDTFHSQYLGDTTVSTAAAALPDLKGYGTLTDLRVAMTLDPSLIDVVNANLPNLDTIDLPTLRAAALPIFVAWAEAVQLPDASGNLQVVDPAAGNTDAAILIETDSDTNTTVNDFAYQFTDNSGNTYWKLASGNSVYDANGSIIAQPTFEQVLAQPGWIDFTAADIGFVSRFYGQPFALDALVSDPTTPLSALTDLVNGAFTALNLDAVRLAMQGPLAQYFPGIAYDVATDSFTATTEAQLAPMYGAIFAAAPSDAAGATTWLSEWLPIINIVLGDFALAQGVEVTYGYQFASMVHAYEQSNLPLSIEAAALALGVPQGEVIEGGGSFSGPNQASIYYLHGGDQTVTAGVGLNNFVMGGTFGNDTIIDDEPAVTSSDDPSILRFTNVASTGITATRDGLDLILSVNGTGEQVTVMNEFNGVELSFNGANFSDYWGVQQIQFSDGVLWDMPDIAQAVSRPEPNEATILGTPGMDVLDGGVGGNNYLSGGDGSDIYKFGLGYGHDTINVNRGDPFNASTDYVEFGAGISFSDLTFSRQGDSDDLSITVDGTGDSLTILGQFDAGYSLFGPLWLDRIEAFAFADGSTYSWDQIIQEMDSQQLPAMYGFDYDDTLNPGAGVHFLSGENGNDTYIFDFGYSFDTVLDNTGNPLSGMNNTIQFGDDVTEQDVTFSMASNSRNLVITLSDGSTMLVEGEFALNAGLDSFNLITNFDFADGTILTYDQILAQIIVQEETAPIGVVNGSDYADTFDTGPNGGYHYLSGGDAGNGNDIYTFGHGYGNQTVDVNWSNLLRRDGEIITFTADVTEADVQWSAMGQDLVIKLAGSNDSLIVLDQFAPWYDEDGVTSFAFVDGTTLGLADMANLVFDGRGGGATINISNEQNLRQGPGVFQAGPGDVFIGNGAVPFTTAGNTFDFDQGDGRDVIVDPAGNGIADNISFGASITPDMVNVELLGTSMVFTFTGSNDRITWMDYGGYSQDGNVFDAIGSVTFADGTAWSTSDLIAMANVAPALSIMQNGQPATPTYNGGDYEVDYNAANGYAMVTLPYEQQGTTTTLRISGLDPSDLDIQRVGFPEADGDAPATAILISAADSTAGGLLIEGPQYSTDLEFDQIVFDDGTTWSKAQVEQMLVDQASTSTGNTEIDGFAGNDTLYAGTGDDVLAGGTGNDTYVYQSGDGFAQIVVNKPSGSGYVDTLDFTDIASTAVTLLRWPGNGINNLVIAIPGQNGALQGEVTIENQFGYGGENQANAAINQFVFSDGVTWTEQDIESQLIAQEEAQTSPNIDIYGFNGSDTLSAVAGISTLIGGAGADTYVWNAGDGATWISDQGNLDSGYINETDTLLIHDIDPSTMTVTRDPTPGSNNLILTAPGQSPIILENQTGPGSNSVIEQVVFDDGTVWDDIQLLIQADGGIATVPNGTTARSFAGAAVNSTMNGTSSDDVYFWGAGDGDDAIVEGNQDPWEKADTLNLVGLDPGDVTLNIIQGGNRDLLITDKATGETLTVAGQFSSASNDDSNNWPGAGTGIELLQFADGTIWEPQQILDSSAYIAAPGATTLANEGLGNGSIPLQASPGVQILYGREHIDNTYIWSPGDGSDTIYYGGYGGVDTLRLSGIAESDVQLIRSGNTLIVNDAVSGESITIPFIFPDQTTDGVGQIVFDDGTVWNSAYINANAAIYAGTGDNTIYGPSDPVIFNLLAAGNDYVYGGGNGDTFLDGPNSGNDTINESGAPSAINTLDLTGISPSEVQLSRWGNNLYVERLDSGESLLVLNQFSTSQPNGGVEKIVFDDGTVWNLATIEANAGPLTFTWIGTTSNTTLTGSQVGNNIFDLGPDGDTVIFGSNGANTILFDKGDGQVQVNLNGGAGIVQMASDIAGGDAILQTDDNGDLIIALRDDNGDGITVDNDLVQHWWGVSSQLTQINFADGSVLNLGPLTFTWIGMASDTALTGSPYGNNVFDLGPGGDTVTFGNNGANTIVFDKGDGQVQVNLNGGAGIVQMASDITDDDVILQADNNGDLTIALLDDASDNITVDNALHQNWWGVSSSLQQIAFADGTTLTVGMTGSQQGQPPTFTWFGTASDTALTGSGYGSNVFDLGVGGDTVTFGNGNDGGGNNNTLVFDKGDGQVQVTLNGGIGTVQMASGIAADDVYLQADNFGDLTIKLRDSSDSITVNNDLGQNWWGISSQLTQIAFADGSTLNIGQPSYNQNPPPTLTWIGTAFDTTLTGSNYGSNTFDLGPGGDNVTFSYSGTNTVVFDKGDGEAQVNVNGGTGVLQIAADIADDDVIFQADNNGDLTVALRDDASDSVTFNNALQQHWWGISSQITQIVFGDGSMLNLGPVTLTWIGTASDTTLIGSDYGNNTFDLGPGGDNVTFSNSGSNTVVFDKGDGQAQVNVNGGSGILQVAADIAGDDVIFQADNNGDLTVALRDDASDSVTFANALQQHWWGFSSQLTQIDFADGSSLYVSGPFNFTWIGTASDRTLTGSAAGNNTYDLGPGGDTVNFSNGGANTIVFDKGDGQVLVNTNGGTGIVQMAADIADNDIYLQADGAGDLFIHLYDSSDSITVYNDLTQYWWGTSTQITEIVFADGTTMNVLPLSATQVVSGNNETLTSSGSGNNTLDATGAYDVLIGGSGADLLESSGHNNTLIAGNGANTLISTGTDDTLFGGLADNILNGSGGIGTVAAYTLDGVTIDLATGTAANEWGYSDTLIGIDAAAAYGSGDTLIGGAGTTLISDAAGNTLSAGAGSPIALYSADDLTVNLAAGTASVNGATTHDVLVGITAAAISGSNDTIVADGGADTLMAEGSNDTLFGNAAGSTLNGAAGSGTVAIYKANDVTVNLAAGTASVNGSITNDLLAGIAAVTVSGKSDTVIAGGTVDTLVASGSKDVLYGNAAGSTLDGVAAGTAAVYAMNNVTVDLSAGIATVSGSAASDTLLGINTVTVTGSGDTLIGGPGTQTLTSSGSNNTLIAGTGLDTLSSSGTGDVLRSNVTGNVLKSTGTLTVASYDLNNVTVNLATGKATISGISTGDTLTGIKRTSVTGNNDTLIAGAGVEVLSASGTGDTLIGGSGADTFISNAGGNVLQAGSGGATAAYTANGLTVNLGTGQAAINGAGVSDTLIGITRAVVTGNNDTLITDGTTDTLSAIGNNDTLIGGAAVSTLSATGSGDTLLGGSASTTLISNAGGNTLEAGTGRAVASYSASGLTVNLVTDTAVLNGSGVSDTLVGIVDVAVTGNNDTLIADGSSDTLAVTGNNGTLMGGSATSTLTATGSGDVLLGSAGTTTLISNASGNTLTAGSGLTVAQYSTANVAVNLASGTAGVNGTGVNDTLVGIVDVVVSGTGDTVTAGTGPDTLTAKGKSDTLIGGSGVDTLTTTSSGDLLMGGSGTTTLVGNANGNTLETGNGQTVASYALGNLTVDLGAGTATQGTGSDALVGIIDVTVTGSSDTLIAGAALETLVASGGNDTLVAASGGSDTLQVMSGSNDTLVATVGGNSLIGDSSHTTAVYTGNGLTIDLATGTAEINATGVTDALIGITGIVVTGSDDTVIADGGNDTLSVIGSNDTLIGGSGTATLSSTGSGDTLIGGSGTTTLIGNPGGDTLEAGTGKAIATYAANSLAVNLATGTAAINGASASDTLIGITSVVTSGSNDTLTAGSGTDTLTANGNGTTLIAGSGNDRLIDNGTGGFYQFGRGDGTATIVNGASGATGPSNELDFGAGIADNQLWFLKSGNNLQIDIMGTSSHVTESGWFSNTGNDLQEITAGGLKIDSQVSQLVQAMATYSANNHGFNPTASGNTQAPNDPTLQAAIAAAWHH